MIVHQVHSPASGRVSGWVMEKAAKAASSTCSRNRPDAIASTTYPMATMRVFVMSQPKRLAGQPGLEPGTCGFGDRRSTIGATGLRRAYFVSLCSVCLRQRGQNLGRTSLSVMVRLFLVVV